MASGSGSMFPTGKPPTAEGAISLQAFYSANSARKQYQSNGADVLYGGAQAPHALDLATGDPAFIDIDTKNGAIFGGSGDVYCLSSLAGIASSAATEFPGDENMQRQAVMNSIIPLGIATTDQPFADSQYQGGVMVQIAGKQSISAFYPLPAGVPAVWHIPSAREWEAFLASDRAVLPSGHPPTKVTMVAKPYVPQEMGEVVKTHIRSFTANEEGYRRAMGSRLRGTQAWANAVVGLTETAKVHGLILVEMLLKKGVLKVDSADMEAGDTYDRKKNLYSHILHPVPDGASADQVKTATMTLPADIVAALALALGVTQDVTAPPGCQLDQKSRTLWKAVSSELTKRQWTDGLVANEEFGFDDSRKINPNRDLQSSKIRTSTAQGAFLRKQLDGPTRAIGAVAEAIERDRRFLAGTIVQGAVPGKRGQIVLH